MMLPVMTELPSDADLLEQGDVHPAWPLMQAQQVARVQNFTLDTHSTRIRRRISACIAAVQ